MIRATAARLTTAPPAALAAGLGLVHLGLALLALDPTPHSGGDGVAYLTLAASILERGEYLQLWDPAAHAHGQYPPGFPLMLAGMLAVGLSSWTALKTLVILCSAGAVALSYLWMRRRGEPGVALGLGLVLAVSPGIIENAHWVLSDVPFWTATMATLWFAARANPAGAVASAFAALLLRTAGLPLVLAVAGWLALRRRWGWAAGVLGALGALALVWTMRADIGYDSQFWLADPYRPDLGTVDAGGLLGRVVRNAELYGFGIMMEFLVGATGLFVDLFAAALMAFAAVGWARRMRSPGVPELLLPLYLGMILAWPEPWTAARMLLPVLPVILAFAAEGVTILPPRSPAILRVGGLLLLLLGAGPGVVGLAQRGALCRATASEFPSPCLHPELRAFVALAAWTEGRLPPGSAVLSRKPTFFYFYGRVPGRTYPFTARPDALFEEAERAGARYLVVDRLGAVSASYLLPTLATRPERFCAVRVMRLEQGEAVLLGILPESAARRQQVEPRQENGVLELDFPACPADYLR